MIFASISAQAFQLNQAAGVSSSMVEDTARTGVSDLHKSIESHASHCHLRSSSRSRYPAIGQQPFIDLLSRPLGTLMDRVVSGRSARSQAY